MVATCPSMPSQPLNVLATSAPRKDSTSGWCSTPTVASNLLGLTPRAKSSPTQSNSGIRTAPSQHHWLRTGLPMVYRLSPTCLQTLLHQQPFPNSMPSLTSETSLSCGASWAHPQQGTTTVQLPAVQGWSPWSSPQHLLSKLQGWVPVLRRLGRLPLHRRPHGAHNVLTQLLSLHGVLHLLMIHLQGWISYPLQGWPIHHLQGWPMNPVCRQLSQ